MGPQSALFGLMCATSSKLDSAAPTEDRGIAMCRIPAGSFGSGMPPPGRKMYSKSGCIVQPVMISH